MFIEASRPTPEFTGGKSSSTHVFQRLLLVLFAAMLVLPSAGCSSGLRLGSLGLGDALLEGYRDRVWAKRAFNLRYNNCDIAYQSHFQNGFVAGYCDTCNGGDGYVPALPPQEYRGFEYQSPDGSQCVKTWFDGFPAGVAAARKDRAGEFHDIYTSRMINSAITTNDAKHILPGDVPVLTTNELGVAHRTDPPANANNNNANNSITGTNQGSQRSALYASPPTPANGPLLSNRSEPTDQSLAPVIRKNGPTAMAPISKMRQFTIDPSVKVQSSIVSQTAAPIATVDKYALTPAPLTTRDEPAAVPPIVPAPTSPFVSTTMPPIVSTQRAQAEAIPLVVKPQLAAPLPQPVAQPVAKNTSGSQTPLPMAVRTANDGWRSQTSSRRRY